MFKGNCTSNQNWACFVWYLKIISTFVKSNIIILKKMWRVTEKRYLKSAPTCVWFTNTRSQSIINTWRDTKFAQLWFSHLGTKESNLDACHTIIQSIQNSTVLEPLILYLYIALSMGGGVYSLHAIISWTPYLKRLLHAYDWKVFIPNQ